MPPYARRRHLVASNGHDAWDALPDIIADTLILRGTDDQLAPYANAGLLAGRIFAATLHTFYGAWHAYFEECREEAGSAVLDFCGVERSARAGLVIDVLAQQCADVANVLRH